MKLVLYKNNSENYKVKKDIVEVKSMDGYLRKGSNLIAPSIKIEYTDPTTFNYAYIPEFKRYYYVTDINIAYNNILILSLNVDVLMSFKDNILNLSGVIARQENPIYQNLYLNDNNIQSYSTVNNAILLFDGRDFSQDVLNNILIISGGNTSDIATLTIQYIWYDPITYEVNYIKTPDQQTYLKGSEYTIEPPTIPGYIYIGKTQLTGVINSDMAISLQYEKEGGT